MQPLLCGHWVLCFRLNFSFSTSDSWKSVKPLSTHLTTLLCFNACLFFLFFLILWTINKARKCFSGYQNTIISAESSVYMHELGFWWILSPVFRGCKEPSSTCSSVDNTDLCFYIFRNARGLKAKLLINVYLKGKAKQPPPKVL